MWVEIFMERRKIKWILSPPAREVWVEIDVKIIIFDEFNVASREGGVG